MNRMIKISFSILLLCSCLVSSVLAKPNLIVTTDIGGDPDDYQSMTRLMLYSNEFNILGLVASSAGVPGQLSTAIVKPELISEIVSNYGGIRNNLLSYDSSYPTSSYLSGVVAAGNPNRGTAYVGASHATAGSNLIVNKVDAASDIVNITIWGGATDVAQAFYQVLNDGSRSAQNKADWVAKVHIYSILDQDGYNTTLAWIRNHAPDVWMLEMGPSSINGFDCMGRGMYQNDSLRYNGTVTQLVQNNVWNYNNENWVLSNVRNHAGGLGTNYPIPIQNPPSTHNTSGVKEGDTPSWFYFLNNGLSDVNHPEWGGWGGRFIYVSNQYWTDAAVFDNHWSGTSDGATRRKWSVARWRVAYQNDFAARLDRASGSGANKNPVVVLNGDSSKDVLLLTAVPGTTVNLSASGTTDPNGNGLSYSWWQYKEVDSYSGSVSISNSTSSSASFTMPSGSVGQSVHIILEVTDNGSPNLTSYRRAVVTGVSQSGGSIGLVGYWKLDETSGTSAADASGSGITGTLNGGPAWTTGTDGNALSFDGSNDYVQLGNPSALQLTGAMTLSAWVKVDTFSNAGRIISKQGVSGQRGWSLNVESTGKAAFQLASSSTSLVIVESQQTLQAGQWYLLTGVYEPGTALRLYVNGSQDASNTSSIPMVQYNSGLNVTIGSRPDGSTYFDGTIDDVRVYDEALSASEVSDLYTGDPGSGGGLTLTVNDSGNAGDWSVRSNLQQGDLQYGDRTYTISSIPSSLVGADWIRTANDSKAYTGTTLVSFTVDEDTDVYVAHSDLITTKPSWLQSGWTDTGLDIVNNESTPRTFSLYKKTFTASSTVNLGSNGDTLIGMYTIILSPATSGFAITVHDSANASDWAYLTNLQTGNQQYGDRGFTFTSVPSAFLGAEWIQTANDSKSYGSDPLVEFDVSVATDVYVAHNDDIATKPSWLQSGWTDTGYDLVNNESPPRTFSLYEKSYAASSTVALGRNGGSGEGMYTIVLLPASGGSSQVEIDSEKDAYVRGGGYASSNFGTSSELWVKDANGSDYDRQTYLQFVLSGVSGSVTSATLELVPSTVGVDAATSEYQVLLVSDDSWSESGITWNNRPSGSTVVATIDGSTISQGQPLQIDVTSVVSAEAAGDGVLSLVMVPLDTGDETHVVFASYEASSNGPKLIVETNP